MSVGGPMVIKSANYNLSVKGLLFEKYASRKVSGAGIAETFMGFGTYDVSGGITYKGSEILVEAKVKLTIKAGGVTVELTPASIKVSGDFKGQCESVQGSSTSYG